MKNNLQNASFERSLLKILFFLIVCFSCNNAFAIEDSLKKSVEIAAHASKFQAERIKIAAENMANEHSTSSKTGGNPYRRKIIFVKNSYDKVINANLVKIKKVDFDKSDFFLKYEPNHPAADKEGYVKYPNVNRIIERADASEAQRGYEANLAIIEMSNSLIQKTVEAIR